MSLDHAASHDEPQILTPVAHAPVSILPSFPPRAQPMSNHSQSSLPVLVAPQHNGTTSPFSQDTAPHLTTTSIDGPRLAGPELDISTTAIPSPVRDVDPQIIEALRGKDRIYVLKLGELMESLINDEHRQRIELTPATSYQRLLVHRCSAYYKLTPEVDSTSKTINVYSTLESRIPSLKISELVPPETSAAPAFKIMRRLSSDRRNKPPHQAGSVTGEDGDLSDLEPSETGSLGGRSNTTGGSAKKHMTIEEREAAYNEARSRIFMDFQEKEKVKDKDVNSSSSSLSATSGSVKTGGSSAGDADSSSGSPATESEWSGPVPRERRQNSGYASASSSTRSIRSSAYISTGSGSSRNSRAASPSSFQYPSLYEPTPPAMPPYDPAQQHSAPAATVYHPPYGYTYNHGQPNPPYMPYQTYYPPPYPPYSSPHPPHTALDPTTSSSGEAYAPPPHMSYGPAYVWPHSGQSGVQSPPVQPQPVSSQPPSTMPHVMSPPPHGQPPYQPYIPPPSHHPYPYPMPGYYPNQPAHPIPPPPPLPPAQPPHMSGPQLFDPRAANPGVGNGQTNVFRNGMNANNILPPNNNCPPQRNGYNPPMNGNGPKPRSGGTVQPSRAPWSYGPGVGSGGIVTNLPSQSNDTVGPRLSNNRRQSNMSNSSINGRSASGDDVSSVASSASSSSRRTQTMSAGSQHPLPPRPDWAINLKPHNSSRNMSPIPPPRSISGGSVQSNYSSRHPNPPISLQSTDFPPLTTTNMQPPERRPSGAWGNPGSRPIFGQTNNVMSPLSTMNTEINNRLDETGFERPPPKSSELYNPKMPKRVPMTSETTKVQNRSDESRGEISGMVEQVTALSIANSASTVDCSIPTSTLAATAPPTVPSIALSQ